MSGFGKLMFAVFVVWTIISLYAYSLAKSQYEFFQKAFFTVIIGYIIIIVIVAVARKMVSRM